MREKLDRYKPLICSVVMIYLFIHYWDSIINLIAVCIRAATPLIVGCVIAYIVNIIMSFYETKIFGKLLNGKMKSAARPVSLLLALVSVIAMLLFLISMVVPQLIESIHILVMYLPTQLETLFNDLKEYSWFRETIMGIPNVDELLLNGQMDWHAIVSKAGTVAVDGISNAVGSVVGIVSSVFSTLFSMILALIFAIYLLSGKEKLRRQVDTLCSAYMKDGVKDKLYHIIHVLNDSYHSYFVGQVTDAFILGTLCVLLMTLFRFPYAVMIGSLVGFCGLIPILGAYIGAVVGCFMILTQSPVQAVLFLIFILVLQQVDGNLIYPRIMGNKLGLPGMWVLAAVTVGGGIMGIAGMVLGVPLAGALYRLLKESVKKRQESVECKD